MNWQDFVSNGGLLIAAVGLIFAFFKYFSDRRDRQQEKLEARLVERIDKESAKHDERAEKLKKRMDRDKAEVFKRIDKSDEKNEKQLGGVNEQLRDLNRRTGVVEGAVVGVQVLQREPRAMVAAMAAQSVPPPKQPPRSEE